MKPPLVSIGLPVRNGAATLGPVVASVLAQEHHDLELVICDNESTDGTEELCRRLARDDSRIVYHRHPQNVGLTPNFTATVARARGTFFRWIGDDDWLHPDYVGRCLEFFAADPRLVLVTTAIQYRTPDGDVVTGARADPGFGSDDPVRRFREVLRLYTAGFDAVDPMYGMARRNVVGAIPRRRLFRDDEIFAARLGFAGPWGHRPEVLARRTWRYEPLIELAGRLSLPRWRARVATPLQLRELLRVVADADLTAGQHRRAALEVARLSGRRALRAGERAGRKARALIATG